MPDENGFWTAAEQEAYRGAGDGGEAPGTTEEDRQARREQTYGTQTYTDPTGAAVRGWEGSWQADPLAGAAGGGLWMPGEAGRDWGAGSASRANPAGFSTMLRDMAPDTFGAGTNILATMQGRGLYGGGYNPGGGAPAEQPSATMNLPARSRQAAMNPGGQMVAPSAQAQGNPFQAFMDWFGGQQKWEPGASMVDFTGLAPFDPQSGRNLGGPTDLGSIYGPQGIQPPVLGRRGQSFLPGYQNVGTSYSTELMRSNPGLFTAGLQQQQLQNPGQTVSGPLSPWLPGQLTGGQAMANPAPDAYAQAGLHQGPGAFGPGGPGRPGGGGPAAQARPAAAPAPTPQGGGLGGASLGGPGGPANLGGGSLDIGSLLQMLLGGGGGGFGLGSPGGVPGGGGVMDMLSLLQGLQSIYGGVRPFQPQGGGMNPFQPRFQARPPSLGRGGASMLYPAFAQQSRGGF